MNAPSLHLLSALGLHLAAGVVLGLAFFRTLWWSSRRIVGGGGPLLVLASTLGRFALLGGALALASLEGAGPLLAMALGIPIARGLAMRRIRGVAR